MGALGSSAVMGRQIRVVGIESTLRNLERFGGPIYRKHVKAALRKTSKGVLRAVKAAAPKETGALKKSMGAKVTVRRGAARKGGRMTKSAAAYAVVGPRRRWTQTAVRRDTGQQETRRPTKYIHLIEGAVASHPVKTTFADGRILRRPSQHPGTVARPFIEKTARSMAGQVRSAFANELRQALSDAARQAKTRAA